jgi:hypothetical protein
MKNNTSNLRCSLIFNSQICDIKVGLKCEIIRKFQLTDIQRRDSCWQTLIIPALPIARQTLRDYFEGYSEFYFQLMFTYSMTSRGTSQHILRIYCRQAPLHVHRHLIFCAMYNKHTAAVSTGHKAAMQLSSVSQPCARGILTSRIGRCLEPHKNGLLMPQLSVYYKGSLAIIFRLLFCVSVRIGCTYRGRNIG